MGVAPVYNFYITANSPGEVGGFVSPVIKRLKRKFPESTVTVILLPCSFSTGTEKDVLESLPEVDRVIPPGGLVNFRKSLRPEKKGAVLHFGGDLFYASMLSKSLGLPTFAYIWARKSADKYITAYFVKSEKDTKRLLGQGIKWEKIFETGDLVADEVGDAMNESPPCFKPPGAIRFCFMPGSRVSELKPLIPFFLHVSAILKDKYPQSEFYMMVSPFISKDKLEAVLSDIKSHPKMAGIPGRYNPETGEVISEHGAGFKLITEHQKPLLSTADLVIMIPGTKTAEAGVLGRPMLVFLPLNDPSKIPHYGIIGLLDYIPAVGPYIKGRILLKIAGKFGFMAQPNILAGEEIVPEMMGTIYPIDIANKCADLIRNPEKREDMNRKLLELYSPFKGSADRLVDAVAGFIGEGRP
ncbi:MAG: hypothetical protein M1269_05745 [Chloroflexi bacterium]|nr:hypothetical protein [Chloroflexota bacterium]